MPKMNHRNAVLGVLLVAILLTACEQNGTSALRVSFLGQDGGSYAGRQCNEGTIADNVHIHLDGLRTDKEPVSYRVDDRSAGGVWATPCNAVSNWLLFVVPSSPGQADLYFKPFRNAPGGTEYTIMIEYSDGIAQIARVAGSQVELAIKATFLGQDGGSYAGQQCTTGTTADNVHIRLDGLRTDSQIVSWRVEDRTAGGVWATPCNPVSNWLLFVTSSSPGQADLFFKPFRDAPTGTVYTIYAHYSDGTTEITTVTGSQVKP